MTTSEFRSERGRCAAIRRVMDMAVFKQMIEAIFTDLDLTEAHLMNQNLNSPTPNVEMRLTNQRKGYNDLLNAMKMCCEPEVTVQMPPETYGADNATEEMIRGLDAGWQPLEP